MRKAIKNKLAGPRKLVRRVLSKSSSDLQKSHPQCETNPQNPSVFMTEEQQVAQEIGALRDQIENLKAAVATLQNDAEKKEVALANIAREKEKLTIDLLKQKRSNHHLAKQLEDERKFYQQEKELYCQEMNEIKKLKKTLSAATVQLDQSSVEHYKSETVKVKQTLNQTLEANYNLSIKFLRMKNTKTCLKTELKTMKLEREKLVNDYRSKIETLSGELCDLINEKLKSNSISASSKKYLQLVKQNSCLVYDNLCLQLEVDNLNLKCEKLKTEKSKREINSRLSYISHGENTTQLPPSRQNKRIKDHSRRVRINEEKPEKLEKEICKPSASSAPYNTPKNKSKGDDIITIFERNRNLPAPLPEIKIVNEKPQLIKTNTKSKLENLHQPCCSKGEPHERHFYASSPVENSRIQPNMEHILNKDFSKLALFQVSECQSSQSQGSIASSGILRVQSSPEIVQSTLFKNSRNK